MSQLNIPSAILNITGTKFSAAISTVEDTTTVFDSPSGWIHARPVPGYPQDLYIPFGDDNQLPFDLIRLVGSDEVTSQNKLFNVLTCYGAGLQLNDTTTNQPTRDPNVLNWARRQNLPTYMLEQMTDMKYFYYSVAIVILNRAGDRINKLRHLDACFCRLAKAHPNGRIPFVYYANWQNNQEGVSGVERIPLLDTTDPFGDLCTRMGRAEDGPQHEARPRTHERKFAILLKFPTAGNQYYPTPYWSAVLRGGSYDEKRLISVGKRAKLRNTTTAKYQVEIERSYWDRLFIRENLNDPEQQEKRIRKEYENIRDFLSGIENSGKVWISGYLVDPNGHEVRDVRINNIEGQKEGGDWDEDVQAAANTICYADNVHPNLVGAVPGKSSGNNSGSDKRELFTMKQSLEIAFHDVLLRPLHLVMWYNGWTNIEPTIPMIQLTTLDEHKDTKRINPAQR